jgi:hypothetical protein
MIESVDSPAMTDFFITVREAPWPIFKKQDFEKQ